MIKAKIVSLDSSDFHRGTEEMLDKLAKGEITAAVIVWESKEIVSYWWTGKAKCTRIIGMLEYVKSAVIKYLDQQEE